MIRAVLDANAIASGVLGIERAESTPGAIMRSWDRGEFALVTSGSLISEVERTLANAYFAPRIPRPLVERTLLSLRQDAVLTENTVAVSGVASHPEDDLVLAAAVSAGAEYLVTGDRQLLALGRYEGGEIVSPRAFLDLLEQQAQQAQQAEEGTDGS